MLLRAWLILFAALCLVGCGEDRKIEYNYFDGSGNRYRLTQEPVVLEYFPIQAQESSSGVYSGGEAFRLELNRGQWYELVAAFNAAMSDTTHHIQDRVMLSGLIAMQGESGSSEYLIAPNSPPKARIEELLRAFMPE